MKLKLSIIIFLCHFLIYYSCHYYEEDHLGSSFEELTLPVGLGTDVTVLTDSTISIKSTFKNFTYLSETQEIVEIGHCWDTGEFDFGILASEMDFQKAFSAENINSIPNRNISIMGKDLTTSDYITSKSTINVKHYTSYWIAWYFLMNETDIYYSTNLREFKNVPRIPYFKETYITEKLTTQSQDPYISLYCDIYNLYEVTLVHYLSKTGYCWNKGTEIPTIESSIIEDYLPNSGRREYWDDTDIITGDLFVQENVTYTLRPYAILNGVNAYYGDTITYTYHSK